MNFEKTATGTFAYRHIGFLKGYLRLTWHNEVKSHIFVSFISDDIFHDLDLDSFESICWWDQYSEEEIVDFIKPLHVVRDHIDSPECKIIFRRNIRFVIGVDGEYIPYM